MGGERGVRWLDGERERLGPAHPSLAEFRLSRQTDLPKATLRGHRVGPDPRAGRAGRSRRAGIHRSEALCAGPPQFRAGLQASRREAICEERDQVVRSGHQGLPSGPPARRSTGAKAGGEDTYSAVRPGGRARAQSESGTEAVKDQGRAILGAGHVSSVGNRLSLRPSRRALPRPSMRIQQGADVGPQTRWTERRQ